MRKLIVTEWITVDGFIAGANGEMDWVTSIFDETMGKYEGTIIDTADTLLLGRVTYDSFAGSWPKVPENPNVSAEEKEYAGKLNAMRKVVFSKTVTNPTWNNTAIMKDIIPEEIQKLKEEGGKDILIYGSASIVQALTNLGLIDEYQLLVHPVILGSGKPLFKDIKEKKDLKLIDSVIHPSGVVRLVYQKK
jgi:dihydrofolate reductase